MRPSIAELRPLVFSRYIIAWKLCTTMKAEDVTDTLTMALQASGCDSARAVPRLLSDNVLGAEGNRESSQSLSVRRHALAA